MEDDPKGALERTLATRTGTALSLARAGLTLLALGDDNSTSFHEALNLAEIVFERFVLIDDETLLCAELDEQSLHVVDRSARNIRRRRPRPMRVSRHVGFRKMAVPEEGQLTSVFENSSLSTNSLTPISCMLVSANATPTVLTLSLA